MIISIFFIATGCAAKFEDLSAAIAETESAKNYTIDVNSTVTTSGSTTGMTILMTVKITETSLYMKIDTVGIIQETYCYKDGENYYLASLTGGAITVKETITVAEFNETMNGFIGEVASYDSEGLGKLTAEDYTIKGSTFEVSGEKISSLFEEGMSNGKLSITISGGKISVMEMSFEMDVLGVSMKTEAKINYKDYGNTEINVPQNVKDHN